MRCRAIIPPTIGGLQFHQGAAFLSLFFLPTVAPATLLTVLPLGALRLLGTPQAVTLLYGGAGCHHTYDDDEPVALPASFFLARLVLAWTLAATLHEAGIVTQRPLEVVNWTNEEGARFGPGLMGSAVFAGVLDLAAAHASFDRTGLRFGDELRRIRYAGVAPVGGRAVDSYFELHIEQGLLLERAGVTIGAVTHSHYSIFADLECLGANAHTQSEPMLRRRNALVGAAKMIDAIDVVGRAHAPAGSASAVVIDAWPNNRINIPHRATFSYGLMHPDEAGMLEMATEIDAAQARIAAETGLLFNTLVRRRRDPVHFDETMVALTEACAANWQSIPCGAKILDGARK